MSQTYAEHEQARLARLASERPKGYRQRAQERRADDIHRELKRDVREMRRQGRGAAA